MTTTKYTKVKSKFIREKIKNAGWKKDREYIDDLIRIERYICGETFGWVTGYVVQGLKNSYPKEFRAISVELYPKDWEEEKKREDKEAEEERMEEKRWRKEERLEGERDRKEWIKAGGKVK